MKNNCFVLTFLIISRCLLLCNATEIACEDDECTDDDPYNPNRCCLLTEAAINSTDFSISGPEDESVRLFDSSRNQKVEFLPIRIGDKFPNLVTFAAERCAIREITKTNFENLFHLRTLNLNNNRLESIRVDTFRDLMSLKTLLLAKNKIKAFESELFGSLWNLKTLNLMSNPCINMALTNIHRPILFVTKKCEKTESEEVKPKCEVTQKCAIGEKCCLLSKFKIDSRLDLMWLSGYFNEVDAISYENNPKVEFLLLIEGWRFPKLTAYDASNCSVREIFSRNFEGFEKLESINLANNKISELKELLFDKMPLKNLNLSNNRIKFLTTKQFENLLPTLEIVDLTSNVCVNGKFSGEEVVSSVNASCYFERQKDNSNELLCENFLRLRGIRCTIGKETEIFSQDCKITSTEYPRIQSLEISGNRQVENVHYLPVVNRFIRNLIDYEVTDAAVRAIGKKNFDGMIWLERLTIQGTLIETIPKDTFQGLKRLEYINLGKNKIIFVAGSAFDNLAALQDVDLRFNGCINQRFEGEEEILGLSQTVTGNCGLIENGNQVACESITEYPLSDKSKVLKCNMDNYTTIIDITYTFSDLFNDEVKLMDLRDNRNIEFLPISVHQKFPNIIFYYAARCAIKEISKRNFENLIHLEFAYLSENQIYAILSGTFEGLVRLKHIDLNKNKIKFVNIQVFEGPGLEILTLLGNECIDRHSGSFNKVAVRKNFLLEISKKCGFTERQAGKYQISCLKYNCGVDKDRTCCSFDDFLAINSSDFAISNRRHNEVIEINLNQNLKIEFLPVTVFLKFSNVETYNADRCSIREVSKSNFEHLLKLRNLSLGFNRIEIIKHNTFEELQSLEHISLSNSLTFTESFAISQNNLLDNNPIKSMNGRLFEGLRALNFVNLTKTECIDEAFESFERIQFLSNAATELCGFAEVGSADFRKLFGNCSSVPHATGFIVGGKPCEKGQWPFLAAILLKSSRKFFCGRNLITDRHVLTAAHCVHEKYRDKLSATDILVLLGHHSLNSLSEPNSKSLDVKNIFIHDDWSSSDRKYDADLAILTFVKRVDFSPFIQPVCVTDDTQIMELEDGYVVSCRSFKIINISIRLFEQVGWGKDLSNAIYEETPKQALIRAVNDSYCFQSDPALGKIYSHRTFCAKGQGQGPCRGDSGGGFYIKFGSLWTLRGVVSAGPTDLFGVCDINKFTLYTKLINYVDWIQEAISQRNVDSSFN